jgi:hypothetical protein
MTQQGNGPPKGVEASELWSRLATRERPSTLIDFPGKESPGQVAIRVLTVTELQQCRTNAEKEAKKLLGGETRAGDIGYEDVYRNEFVVQVVCLACRQVDDGGKFPAFPSPKHARDRLTEDDFAILWEAYGAWRRESGPILSEMTEPELEAWIRKLQEGGSRVPLATLSSAALQDAILLLIARLPTSPTDSGSAG